MNDHPNPAPHWNHTFVRSYEFVRISNLVKYVQIGCEIVLANHSGLYNWYTCDICPYAIYSDTVAPQTYLDSSECTNVIALDTKGK